MIHKKNYEWIVIVGLVLGFGLLFQPGCTSSPGIDKQDGNLGLLRVRRADGRVETITFAQAMAKHHEGEHHDAHDHAHVNDAVSSATAGKMSAEHSDDEEVCVGVATGYQAIRYAAAKLFPGGEIPTTSDFEMSVDGGMRGVRDILEMYFGRKPAPSKLSGGTLSIESFTFSARRVSTGETIKFRLRDGLIPQEFFKLKNRGVSCGDPALEAIKRRVAEKILSLPPAKCFFNI